jgi:hypothetical protein
MLPVVILIFGTMLMSMLTRVFLPIGQKTEGMVISTVNLPYRYRLLYHRTSIYLLGTAVVLGGIGGWLNTMFEVIIVMATFAIVSIKIRYTFTSQGVALNNVVFRSWSEFSDYKQEARYLRLAAQSGMRDFKILVPVQEQAAIDTMLAKLVRSKEAPVPAAKTVRSDKTTASLRMSRPAKKHS